MYLYSFWVFRLTDMTKLKKRTFSRNFKGSAGTEQESSKEEDSSEGTSDDNQIKFSRKGLKYKNESKRRREEERNELFGFLKEVSSSGIISLNLYRF